MATQGNKIKFVYVPKGETIPSTRDGDTVYFDAEKQELYVGEVLISNVFSSGDMGDFKVKNVTITGTGNNIASATFDANTGVLALVKDDLPELAKGSDTTGTAQTLTAGGTFVAMTDTAVSDHTITDENTSFTLPHQYTSVTLANGANEGEVKLTTVSSDTSQGTGGTTETTIAVFDPDDYMAASNGTATGATITLAAAPTTDMGAATKKYVDDAVEGLTGAMHFVGVATVEITDGSTTDPQIQGYDFSKKQKGDVVLYGGKEFVWTGSAWEELGDEGSFALKTTQVVAGTGLTGGGALNSDVTVAHQAAPSSGSSALPAAITGLEVVSDVTIDTLGHVASASKADLSTAVNSAITTKIETLDFTDNVTGDYVTSVSEADGIISVVKSAKGTVTANNSNLVDGGTVYDAIEAAAVTWQVVS